MTQMWMTQNNPKMNFLNIHNADFFKLKMTSLELSIKGWELII